MVCFHLIPAGIFMHQCAQTECWQTITSIIRYASILACTHCISEWAHHKKSFLLWRAGVASSTYGISSLTLVTSTGRQWKSRESSSVTSVAVPCDMVGSSGPQLLAFSGTAGSTSLLASISLVWGPASTAPAPAVVTAVTGSEGLCKGG